MDNFKKLPSDDFDAPKAYVVRIKLDKEIKSEKHRFIYYKTYTDLAKYLNCSRAKAKNFINNRRTVEFSDYFNFNRKQ